MKYALLGFYLGIVSVFASCKGENPYSGIPEANTVTIDVGIDHWTYFSFRTGDVVGTGALNSQADDLEWYARTDWDIALCGDMIRTNSGTSGKGSGGIQEIEKMSYGAITDAPTDGYHTDTNDVVVKQ